MRRLLWSLLFASMLGSQSVRVVRAFVVVTQATTLRRTRQTTMAAAATASKAAASAARPFRLVIVESPSKCKTIDKILNDYAQEHQLPFSYKVTSCYGHVRNLSKEKIPPNDQQKFPYIVPGVDLTHNYQPLYEIMESKHNVVQELQTLARRAEKILFATDPDREGEAMAWHLQEILLSNNNNNNKNSRQQQSTAAAERVSFTEITPAAVLEAVLPTHRTTGSDDDAPSRQTINPHLVTAQETRRVLDRLVGFTLSPILWKKIAPGLSAGRVQSVGMALTVHRERERLVFESTEYWGVRARLQDTIHATLMSVNGTTVASSGADFTPQGGQLTNPNKLHVKEELAEQLVTNLKGGTWKVKSVESKQVKQQPPQPYRTSTLQQDASRRLGLSVDQTMRCAQELYEAGYISYMRTDSSTLSGPAQQAIQGEIGKIYGKGEYQAQKDGKKHDKKQAKFAQEAHEAIRPALQEGDTFALPAELNGRVGDVAMRLYQMIYQRTLACRMQPLISNRTRVIIEATDGEIRAEFRASGSVVIRPGYTAVYGTPESDDEEEKQLLPPLEAGKTLQVEDLSSSRHETQPPPRFNEASFVKELEDLGVGRPSTYASTVKILRERAYVGSPLTDGGRVSSSARLKTGGAKVAQRAAGGEEFTGATKGVMIPSVSAFVVCDLLEKHCPMIVDPAFTAKMEEQLDAIANGEQPREARTEYLDEFYAGDDGLAARVKQIDEAVDAEDARRVSLPRLDAINETSQESVSVFVGPWGPYVRRTDKENDVSTTVSLPVGMAADLSLITHQALQSLLSSKQAGGLILGQHPGDGRNIRLKTGRYGAFLQWGDDDEESTTTHSLPKSLSNMRNFDMNYNDDTNYDADAPSLDQLLGLSFEDAVGYVNLPRTVSILHDLPIIASLGPYGPYLKYNNTFTSLKPADGNVLIIDAETAEALVTDRIINGKPSGTLAELGEMEGTKVVVKTGRFGTYLNWKRVNAKLPAEYADNPATMPLDEAWKLIKSKSGTEKGKKQSGKLKSSPLLPTAPKRPKSAYLYFCADKRPEIAKTGLSLGEVTKELAALWANASSAERELYDEKAATGKAEYQRLKGEWKKECEQLQGKARTKKKVVKQAKNQSKRPRSAYLIFCAEKRAEVSARISGLGEVTRELARLWSETKDRSVYETQAREEKERYNEPSTTLDAVDDLSDARTLQQVV